MRTSLTAARRSSAAALVVGAVVGAVMGSGPAAADPGAHTAGTLQQASFAPWSGTITEEWREVREFCDGCISSTEVNSGRLVYTITGWTDTLGTLPWSSYEATARGSGNIFSRAVTADGTEECTREWTANDLPAQGLRIGISDATMSPPSVGITNFTSSPPDCGPGQDVVGIFPNDGIGGGPDNEPYEQRPIKDDDPDPNVLRGTTVFAAQPNWDQLKEYVYTLSYDLRRGTTLYMATVKWPRSPWVGATYQARISVPGNTNRFRAWASTGKRRTYVFKNLSLGKYVVEIRAVSKSGKKSPALRKAFEVTTAFPVSK